MEALGHSHDVPADDQKGLVSLSTILTTTKKQHRHTSPRATKGNAVYQVEDDRAQKASLAATGIGLDVFVVFVKTEPRLVVQRVDESPGIACDGSASRQKPAGTINPLGEILSHVLWDPELHQKIALLGKS